jgi:hypothetical protein
VDGASSRARPAEGLEAWGCISCAHWLNWQCGLDLRSARHKVRVARALEGLPLLRAAFAAGRLSYSKVRAITRVATPEDTEVGRNALDTARADLSGENGSAEPPAPGPLAARALVAMAESYLANGPAARDERYPVMLHVDDDVLTDDGDGRCELDDGPAVSADTARRCSSGIGNIPTPTADVVTSR